MAPQYRSKLVLVTRAEGRNASLVQGLGAAGFQPVVCPLLAFEATGAPLPSSWDVLAFTSATAVAFWTGPLRGFIAAVGPRTAEALPRVDLQPQRALAAALAEALGDLRGKRVCYPRAEVVSPAFEEALRAAGAEVDSVPVYRTVLAPGAVLPEHDGVALASGSAARRQRPLEAVRAFPHLVGGFLTATDALDHQPEEDQLGKAEAEGTDGGNLVEVGEL